MTNSGRYRACTRLLAPAARTPDAESCDAGTILRYRSKALAKGARVRFAAYATVGTVALVGTAAVIGGVAQVACLPDPDRPVSDAGSKGDASLALRACGDGFIDPTIDGAPEECDPGQGLKAAVGCSAACRVECEGGVIDPVTKHCYFRLSPSSEPNSRALCGDPRTQAHVVTFASDREVAFLLDAGFASQFWVGLTYHVDRLGYTSENDSNGEPGWNFPGTTGNPISASCPGCYARTGSDASTYFPPLGPDASAPAECVYVDSPTEWHHSPCGQNEHRDTLCEREPPGSRATVCNGGICITVAQTTKRYLFVPSDTTADDAKTSCESLSPNGHLVMFDTREEREQLSRELAQYTGMDGASFWVGLSADPSGAFTWDDGKKDTERPPLFGIDAGAASPGARVFVSILSTDAIDKGLGHTDDPKNLHTYVCEY